MRADDRSRTAWRDGDFAVGAHDHGLGLLKDRCAEIRETVFRIVELRVFVLKGLIRHIGVAARMETEDGDGEEERAWMGNMLEVREL